MKLIKLPALLILTVTLMSSCSKTPEEAAAEICECYENADGIMDKAGCAIDQAEYATDFKGEDLEKFSTAARLCTIKAGKDLIDDVKDSEELENLKEDVLDEIDEAIDDVEDLDVDLEEVQEKLDELGDQIEELEEN